MARRPSRGKHELRHKQTTAAFSKVFVSVVLVLIWPLAEQPQENGGTDAGLTPPEFLLASLGD